MDNRKVVIIGDGAVGSTTAYTLLLQDYVNEIVIIDVNKRKAEGDILDMKHGMPFVSPKILKAGDYSDCKDAHVVIITAGVAQKEGETRIDLLKRNLKVFDSILENVKPYIDDTMVILVVTNPVDILSYYTYKKLGIDSSRVIGSGTVLDSARLRLLISEDTEIDPRNVHAYVIGEHGDSEVSAFSVANIAESPLLEYYTNESNGDPRVRLNKLHDQVKNSAYEIIDKKGATYYAIALSTAKIVETILNNQKSVLTVSTLITKKFNNEIDDVYLSLPAIVGNKGVIKILSLNYSYDEVLKLIESAKTLKKQYKELNI